MARGGGPTMATINCPGGLYGLPQTVRGTVNFNHGRSGGTTHRGGTVLSMTDLPAFRWIKNTSCSYNVAGEREGLGTRIFTT